MGLKPPARLGSLPRNIAKRELRRQGRKRVMARMERLWAARPGWWLDRDSRWIPGYEGPATAWWPWAGGSALTAG